MKSKLLSLLLVATLLVSAFAVMPVSVAEAAAPAQATSPFVEIPVVGDLVPAVGEILAGAFEGTIDITGFVREGGQLFATGVLNGAITDANGVVTDVIDFAAQLPVDLGASGAGASCDILNLVLGPLSLDLLGLNVDLNQVVLDITAQTGSGKLLGNLLCAVTRLLDGPQPLGAIANFLNRILDILG